MFHPVTAAAGEMAGPTVMAFRTFNALGNLVPFRRIVFLSIPRENLGFLDRMPGPGRIFFVGAGAIMADQAVYFCLVGKIKALIFPAVTGMA